jgi:aldehyde:ferredoxin oxidoreductase
VTIDIDTLVKEYHQAMGWDEKTGVPARERLEKLGLAAVVSDLARA